MYPASLSIRPQLAVKWLSLIGLLLAYAGNQSVRTALRIVLQIAWLYVVTGARG
jgi:hypothetical protein